MLHQNKGATSVEYGLFIALIIIFLLLVLSSTGSFLTTLFSEAATGLNSQKKLVMVIKADDAPLAPQNEDCTQGNVTQATADLLNLWADQTNSPADWCALITLNRSGTSTSSPPEEVGQLTNLTHLGLQSNQMTSLPATIGYLVNLRTFYLNDNLLTTVPSSIGNLTAVQTILLSNNTLQSLPEAALMALPNLTTISLEGNPDLSVSADFCTFLDSKTATYDPALCP